MKKTHNNVKNVKKFQKYGLALLILAMVLVGVVLWSSPKAAENFPTTRDKYKWPFSRYSIWNMPIGSGATFKPAGIAPPSVSIRADTNPISLDPNAPVRTVTNSAGTVMRRQARVSPGLTHDGSWNGCAALLSADDPNKIIQGQPLSIGGGDGSWIYDYSRVGNDMTREITNPLRPDEVNFPYDPSLGDTNGELVALNGPGRWGCHGATATSGLGGSIRKGELDGSEPIRHVLKFQPYCHLYCHPTGRNGAPFKWPSYGADSYSLTPGASLNGHQTWYNGQDPDLQQGSLLALKDDFNVQSLGSNHAKKIAQALKDYGAYMVDDAAWDVSQWTVESGVQFGDGGSFDGDMRKIISSLHIVLNNTPTSVGGGGTPRVCYAPPFADNTPDLIQANPNGAVSQPAGCPPSGGGTTPTPSTAPTIAPTPLPSGTPNPGDITGDGHVNFQDLSVLIRNYKKAVTTIAEGDLDRDGMVTILDLSRLVRYWGT